MRALVIDDSKVMRLILCRMLRELDLEVDEAENGRGALDMLEAGLEPSLVIVDWNMPEMSGLEFVAAIRGAPFDSTAPILMVTAETEMAQVARALDAGANEYLMKPFTKESVFAKLQILGIAI